MTTIHGIVRGKIIELERVPGMPDGQLLVAVTIQPIEERPPSISEEGFPGVELWMDRLVFDPAISPIERIVKGTCLPAEALVTELENGIADEAMLESHPELTREDLAALRNYARIPVALRRSFGAWAEDAEELDAYLEWTRRQRRVGHWEVEPFMV